MTAKVTRNNRKLPSRHSRQPRELQLQVERLEARHLLSANFASAEPAQIFVSDADRELPAAFDTAPSLPGLVRVDRSAQRTQQADLAPRDLVQLRPARDEMPGLLATHVSLNHRGREFSRLEPARSWHDRFDGASRNVRPASLGFDWLLSIHASRPALPLTPSMTVTTVWLAVRVTPSLVSDLPSVNDTHSLRDTPAFVPAMSDPIWRTNSLSAPDVRYEPEATYDHDGLKEAASNTLPHSARAADASFDLQHAYGGWIELSYPTSDRRSEQAPSIDNRPPNRSVDVYALGHILKHMFSTDDWDFDFDPPDSESDAADDATGLLGGDIPAEEDLQVEVDKWGDVQGIEHAQAAVRQVDAAIGGMIELARHPPAVVPPTLDLDSADAAREAVSIANLSMELDGAIEYAEVFEFGSTLVRPPRDAEAEQPVLEESSAPLPRKTVAEPTAAHWPWLLLSLPGGCRRPPRKRGRHVRKRSG